MKQSCIKQDNKYRLEPTIIIPQRISVKKQLRGKKVQNLQAILKKSSKNVMKESSFSIVFVMYQDARSSSVHVVTEQMLMDVHD